jgi:hypothetical protein
MNLGRPRFVESNQTTTEPFLFILRYSQSMVAEIDFDHEVNHLWCNLIARMGGEGGQWRIKHHRGSEKA